MTHKDAMDNGAVDKYFLGQLATDERDRFEEHFFSCKECSEEVRVTAIFLDNLKEVLKEPYAIRQEKPAQEIRPVPPAVRRWYFAPQIGLAAGIALLAVVGYQNTVVIPHLNREVAQLAGPQSYPPFFITETRSEPNVVTAGRNDRRVALQFSKVPGQTLGRNDQRGGLQFSKVPGQTFKFYRCELKSAGNQTVSQFTVPVPSQGDEWQLLLPIEGLASGSYTLSVRGAASENAPESAELAQYHFKLKIE
jgi:hypothetical protein